MVCYCRVMPQKITLILRPESAFDLPISEGYQLYSALLAVMEKADPAAAKRAHDSPIGSISLGCLEGRFGRCESKRARHKSVDPAEKYRLSLGITDPQESELFRSIIQPLVLREQNLILEKGELRVEELSSRKSQPMRHPARDIHVKRQNWRLALPGGPARPEHIAYIIIIAGQLFAKSSRSRAPACLHARQMLLEPVPS